VANLRGSDPARILRQLVTEIPWGQNLLILNKISDPTANLYYLCACLAQSDKGRRVGTVGGRQATADRDAGGPPPSRNKGGRVSTIDIIQIDFVEC